MLSEEVKQDLMSRVIIYGAGVPTAAMGWLNTNSSGIQAICTIIVTVLVIYRTYGDYRRNSKQSDSSTSL